jgi:hypothetical protein
LRRKKIGYISDAAAPLRQWRHDLADACPWDVGCTGITVSTTTSIRCTRITWYGAAGDAVRTAAEAVTLERRVQLRCKFHLYRVVTATKLKPHQKLFKQGPRWPSFSVLSSTNRWVERDHWPLASLPCVAITMGPTRQPLKGRGTGSPEWLFVFLSTLSVPKYSYIYTFSKLFFKKISS